MSRKIALITGVSQLGLGFAVARGEPVSGAER